MFIIFAGTGHFNEKMSFIEKPHCRCVILGLLTFLCLADQLRYAWQLLPGGANIN